MLGLEITSYFLGQRFSIRGYSVQGTLDSVCDTLVATTGKVPGAAQPCNDRKPPEEGPAPVSECCVEKLEDKSLSCATSRTPE